MGTRVTRPSEHLAVAIGLAQGEDVWQVANLAHVAVGEQNLDDVETEFHGRIFQEAQVVQRGLREVAALASIYEGRRARPLFRGAGLDLDEHEPVCTVSTENNVLTTFAKIWSHNQLGHTCPTRCWLRFAGEPASVNVYGEWVLSQNESFPQLAIERLRFVISQDEGETVGRTGGDPPQLPPASIRNNKPHHLRKRYKLHIPVIRNVRIKLARKVSPMKNIRIPAEHNHIPGIVHILLTIPPPSSQKADD